MQIRDHQQYRAVPHSQNPADSLVLALIGAAGVACLVASIVLTIGQ